MGLGPRRPRRVETLGARQEHAQRERDGLVSRLRSRALEAGSDTVLEMLPAAHVYLLCLVY